jgi:hypothetical protein
VCVCMNVHNSRPLIISFSCTHTHTHTLIPTHTFRHSHVLTLHTCTRMRTSSSTCVSLLGCDACFNRASICLGCFRTMWSRVCVSCVYVGVLGAIRALWSAFAGSPSAASSVCVAECVLKEVYVTVLCGCVSNVREVCLYECNIPRRNQRHWMQRLVCTALNHTTPHHNTLHYTVVYCTTLH